MIQQLSPEEIEGMRVVCRVGLSCILCSCTCTCMPLALCTLASPSLATMYMYLLPPFFPPSLPPSLLPSLSPSLPPSLLLPPTLPACSHEASRGAGEASVDEATRQAMVRAAVVRDERRRPLRGAHLAHVKPQEQMNAGQEGEYRGVEEEEEEGEEEEGEEEVLVCVFSTICVCTTMPVQYMCYQLLLLTKLNISNTFCFSHHPY